MLTAPAVLPVVPLDGASPWSRTGGDPAAALAAVHRLHPTLSPSGLGYSSAWGWGWTPEQIEQERASLEAPGCLAQFVRAARFLSAHADFATSTPVRWRTSYGWKHVAERWAGDYVSSGAFIAAAVALGFRVEPIAGAPSVYLNLASDDAKRAAA